MIGIIYFFCFCGSASRVCSVVFSFVVYFVYVKVVFVIFG